MTHLRSGLYRTVNLSPITIMVRMTHLRISYLPHCKLVTLDGMKYTVCAANCSKDDSFCLGRTVNPSNKYNLQIELMTHCHTVNLLTSHSVNIFTSREVKNHYSFSTWSLWYHNLTNSRMGGYTVMFVNTFSAFYNI